MKLLKKIKDLFYTVEDDFVVVDLTTKMIQSMNPKDWNRLKDKKNYMVIK
jgi:excinuclease UvrABC nuclease subunit